MTLLEYIAVAVVSICAIGIIVICYIVDKAGG